MNLTVNDIIKSAFRVMGVTAKSEVPTNDEMQDGLQALNMMIDLWSARNLLTLAEVSENFPLVAGTASYTIGVGQTFNTAKPYQITGAYVRDSNNIDLPLNIITRSQYDNIMDKWVQARPEALMYDPGLTQQATNKGTIYLYYTPDASTAYTLFLSSRKALSELSALTSTLTFDKAYSEALKYHLAIRLWREYHDPKNPIPQDITYLAHESMRVIESMNSEPIIAQMEVPGVKSVFNIYTGDFAGGTY